MYLRDAREGEFPGGAACSRMAAYFLRPKSYVMT